METFPFHKLVKQSDICLNGTGHTAKEKISSPSAQMNGHQKAKRGTARFKAQRQKTGAGDGSSQETETGRLLNMLSNRCQ